MTPADKQSCRPLVTRRSRPSTTDHLGMPFCALSMPRYDTLPIRRGLNASITWFEPSREMAFRVTWTRNS